MAIDRQILGEFEKPTLPPLCEKCGYDLRGLTHRRCPECGHITPDSVIRRNSRDIEDQLYAYKGAAELVQIGLYVGLAGLALVLGCFALGVAGLGLLISMLLGLATIGCGAQIFRVLRLPPAVRDRLPQSPNAVFAVGVTILGVFVIVLAYVLL